MCRRLREQARSHREFVWDGDRWCAPDHCGSEPARESGGSGNADVECAGAFAGKPAPTLDIVGCRDLARAANTCGSGLARECAGSGDEDVECAAVFASKPAPTGILSGMEIVGVPRIIVGASLLANAVVQAMVMLNVPAPSRASPLPQGLCLG